jgi:hypothetical protein
MAASLLIVEIVILATIGHGSSAASVEPKRYSRVSECAPSAPTRRLPLSFVPSSKEIVTILFEVSIC